MNKTELSSTSATLNGRASILDDATDKFQFFKQLHLKSTPTESHPYIDSDDVAVIIVKIFRARVADIEHVGSIEQWKDESVDSAPSSRA
jgi:hypothetical protein